MLVDGFRPDRWDLIGAAICLVGVAVIIGYAVALVVLYWVIHLAVRHPIRDADKRRSGTKL